MTAYDIWHDGDWTACDQSPLPKTEYAGDGAAMRTTSIASFRNRKIQIHWPAMLVAWWNEFDLTVCDGPPLPKPKHA
jgi:hypothetical protein